MANRVKWRNQVGSCFLAKEAGFVSKQDKFMILQFEKSLILLKWFDLTI